jgi:Glyoxalase/Bleomycin resistance protein/Dioxygenase superfamily
MTVAPYFHIAIQVRDLDEAMVRFSETLHVTFYPPTLVRNLPAEDDPSTTIFERRATYSYEGPPFLELVEAIPDENGEVYEGPHHVGMFAADLTARAAELIADGLVEERRTVTPEGKTIIWINQPISFFGTRLELFDVGMEYEFTPDRLARFFSKPVRTRIAAPPLVPEDPPATS